MDRRSIHVCKFVGMIFLVLENGISDRLLSLESDKRSRRIFDSYARDINLSFDANRSNGLSAATCRSVLADRYSTVYSRVCNK